MYAERRVAWLVRMITCLAKFPPKLFVGIAKRAVLLARLYCAHKTLSDAWRGFCGWLRVASISCKKIFVRRDQTFEGANKYAINGILTFLVNFAEVIHGVY
jgi:hypothetical protein